MPRRSPLLALVAAGAFAVAAPAFAADALVKPLPQPALGRLPADRSAQLAEARRAFDEARVNLVGDALATAYAQMGVLYAQTGFKDIAAVALADAAALAPGDGRWVYLQGVLAYSQKATAQARQYFEQAFKLDPNYVPLRVALATSLIDEGADDRAAKLLDDYLAGHQDQPKVYALKGQILLRQRRYADAAAALQQALKLDPRADKLYTDLAQALEGQGDRAGAAAARAKAGATPPRLIDPLGTPLVTDADDSGRPRADSPLQQAGFFLSLRQYDAARAQLDAALKQNPDDLAALALYARLEATAGATAAAQQRVAAALKLAPNDALVLLTQGVVKETAGDVAGALPWYEKAAAARPELAEPHRLLGDAAMRARQFGRAADQYRALVRAEPTRGESYAQLAAAMAADGHCAEGVKELSTAGNEHPRLPVLAQAAARLAATCRGATPAERDATRERIKQVYRQMPTPANSEALALAAAAEGKWEDAVQLQGAAIFDAVKGGDQDEIALYKVFFAQFQAKQLPDQPWPAQHPLYHPEPLKPLPPAAK